MKFIVLFCFCAGFAQSWASPVSLSEDESLVDDDQVQTRVASENDMTFHFYTRLSSIGLHTNIGNLASSTDVRRVFNTGLDTLVVIHGWQDNITSNYNYVVRSKALNNHNINVIVVDWHLHADQSYLPAMRAVPSVGRYVGHFLEELSILYNYPLTRMSMVGFSLGAHVAGCAGARLNGVIPQIVGLDPAGPLISASNTDYSLDTTDARYVQIFHTNAGTLGMSAQIGHSDFWPNGGRSQAGCGTDLLGGCAHNRVFELYAESLGTNNFVAQQCGSYSEYTRGTCRGRTALMGGLNVDTTATGNFYLGTNAEEPWATG